jgi:hypothetical protein
MSKGEVDVFFMKYGCPLKRSGYKEDESARITVSEHRSK